MLNTKAELFATQSSEESCTLRSPSTVFLLLTPDFESAGWLTKEYSLNEMSCISTKASLPL